MFIGSLFTGMMTSDMYNFLGGLCRIPFSGKIMPPLASPVPRWGRGEA